VSGVDDDPLNVSHIGALTAHIMKATHMQHLEFLLHFLVLVISNAYAINYVSQMNRDGEPFLCVPIYIARAGGMGATCWTVILYLTMARTLMARAHSLAQERGMQRLITFLDSSKEMHVMAGKAMALCGVVHTLAHSLRAVTHRMTSLTGVLLVGLLFCISRTASEKNRKSNFEYFWYVHNVGIFLWPLLLLFHGCSDSERRVFGFPRGVFWVGVAFLAVVQDRLARTLRYYCSLSNKFEFTVRPGKKGTSEGALTHIQLKKPACLWNFQTGMYACLCMPAYAPLQWHPFTVCSSPFDETVDFLIAGVGDWTRELATQCLKAQTGEGKLPKIAIDGPYASPTMGAINNDVLICVGAGVGITPFLSLMAAITTLVEAEGEGSDPKIFQAHFFWMARSAQEFFFGRQLIARIMLLTSVRCKIFIRLHVTTPLPQNEPRAYVFREALRRQSVIDRGAVKDAFKTVPFDERHMLLDRANYPRSYLSKAKHDLVWLSDLLEGESQESFSHRADGAPIPLLFGRPDFRSEIRAIGKACPGKTVNIYACGNLALVSSLEEACSACNDMAKADETGGVAPSQQFRVRHERFG